MAPEVVDDRIAALQPKSIVLDPMMGSGTFPVTAAALGHTAYGCDSDPLAIVIARTAAGGFDRDGLVAAGAEVLERARHHSDVEANVDDETQKFIDRWFDREAQRKLAGLAAEIEGAPTSLHAPLWCAFSRLIITKDNGVSLARDVSHSRPHRVRDTATVDAFSQFPSAVSAVARRASEGPLRGMFIPLRADARSLPLADKSVDAVTTSPPYLVAIDYLRGHRLSLVWMGYSVSELRGLRRSNIGAEAGVDSCHDLAAIVTSSVGGHLPRRSERILNRYAIDLDAAIAEIARVLTHDGSASFVIADARLSGVEVSIERLLDGLAMRRQLRRAERQVRAIPAQSRYLPPPESGTSALALRMREELIVTYQHS
ncbi:MAG TPA: hypothetical protein VGX28_10880 [Frankiaceae bacterium]|jgi:SAM-dependent methyltransferase|nr:hypothetical protein [Frankiaceae bacterium]